MLHTIIVFAHVISAVGALIAGCLAFTLTKGTQRHRVIGKTYVAMWLIIALTGYTLGADRTISVFEVATAFGVFSTAKAYWVVRKRKQIGPRWMAKHYEWMLSSMAALVVATINQVLPRMGIEYPTWVFVALAISPALIFPFIQRRLDRRYGFAKPSAQTEAQPASPIAQ
jgi:uncharacterized membrane protein